MRRRPGTGWLLGTGLALASVAFGCSAGPQHFLETVELRYGPSTANPQPPDRVDPRAYERRLDFQQDVVGRVREVWTESGGLGVGVSGLAWGSDFITFEVKDPDAFWATIRPLVEDLPWPSGSRAWLNYEDGPPSKSYDLGRD